MGNEYELVWLWMNNKHQQRNRRNQKTSKNVFAHQLFTQWKKEKNHKLFFDIMWYVLDWTQVPSALHDGLSNLQSSILEIVIASFTRKENAARRIKRKSVLLDWFWTDLNGYHGFYIFEIVMGFQRHNRAC